jgi:hypothetical protein
VGPHVSVSKKVAAVSPNDFQLFPQLTAHSSFSTAHSSFCHSHSSTKHNLNLPLLNDIHSCQDLCENGVQAF